MGIAPNRIPQDYWDTLEVNADDIELLYSRMLEEETPLTLDQLSSLLIEQRIKSEIENLTSLRSKKGLVYKPENAYATGDTVQFPALDWKRGVVVGSRAGTNPDLGEFSVIAVEFDDGMKGEFASELAEHDLNQAISADLNDPLLNPGEVESRYGDEIRGKLRHFLEESSDIVRISRHWFPKALLMDIGQGNLNLVEAILEVNGGGPMEAPDILAQLEIPTQSNPRLMAFSLDHAMQVDERFDDVGPSGQTLWYLNRLEPEDVRITPAWIRYVGAQEKDPAITQFLEQFEGTICDEFEDLESTPNGEDEITFPLIYPHLRSGTLPLSRQLFPFFPTAFESSRVQFTLVDQQSDRRYSGWVVRERQYVLGLKEWYAANDIFTGSLITIRKSDIPGEVIIDANRKRPSREWARTAVVGSDGGVVFAMLKHSLATAYSERMAIIIPDTNALDRVWDQGSRNRGPLTNTIRNVMRELAKLSPQGHVHAQELYAAVNIIRRCPPSTILHALIENKWASHLGDLYFRSAEGLEGDS